MDYLNDDIREVKKIIRGKICESIKKFCEKDRYVLENGLHEGAISYRFALCLEEQFKDEKWDIDCEYNRLGKAKKEIGMNSKRVRPDIIVHHRGNPYKKENLLVIEIEKSTGYDHKEKDLEKLKALRTEPEYSYRFSLFLKFNTEADFKGKGRCIDKDNVILEPELPLA